MPAVELEVATARVGVQLGWRSWTVVLVSSVVGLFMIGWPLLMPAGEVGPSNTQVAPYLFVLLLPVVLLLVVSQLGEGGLDAKSLALLSVLAAINAALRPVFGAGTAGIESVFFLLILAGRVFGPGFGYLLGLTSLFASALLTAGIGPWLPSQMLCAAWVGLGAGLLPRRASGRGELWLLVGYGVVAAYLYGMLQNLWFWPFITGTSIEAAGVGAGSLDYVPGAPLAENLVRFAWFTLFTSTAGWDTGRAVTTTIALLLLGRPVLGVLRRASGTAQVSSGSSTR